ncbi:unnamed protein product [Rhizophagus irregularis]|nr:unnamed protein product [Rhizophagus irregularis]CAB4437557.1 unnamed protein product [Rhizophagus irregularis]
MKKTILAIGTTGLGKTTMARLLCEIDVEGSNGIESGTEKAIIYETDEFFYIDTCGFGDSFGTTNEEIFHDIMRLFQKHGKNNIFNIDTILWFCPESVREMDPLKHEANFIQRFVEYTDGYKPIDLWKNVLIITKGTFLSHELINGPKSAAKNACQTFSNMQIDDDSFFVKHFPCWIYDINGNTNARWAKMDSEARFEFNCYRENEIKSKIQHLIPNFSPISVHFKQGKCQKCNAIGDPRLFITKCHTTLIFNHSIKIEYFHPERIVHFHSGSKFLDHEPDEISIKRFFEKMLGSNPTKLPASQVSSEIGKEIIEVCKPDLTVNQVQATPESQPSRMSQVISHVSQAASKVSQVVVSSSILPSIAFLARNSGSASGSKGSIAPPLGLYLLAAAGTSVTVLTICVGGTVYYYETKNISCKRCNKLVGEKGCIEKCDNCKKEWRETGCTIGYGCCKQDEKKPGCKAREKCIMCQEAAIKLNSQGCTQYCVKCKEMWNTPGCDPSFKHNVVIMD